MRIGVSNPAAQKAKGRSEREGSEAASCLSGQPLAGERRLLLHRETPQQTMVNVFAHLDVDHPSIADYNGQSTEPVFLQAREGAEEQRRFSVADARRQARHRVRPIQRSSWMLRCALARTRFR